MPWATLIAQGISAILSFGFLLKKLKGIETDTYSRFEGTLLKNMVKVAIVEDQAVAYQKGAREILGILENKRHVKNSFPPSVSPT